MNIIRKIFSPSCLGISLLLLFYTFYKSEIYWNGTKSNYYIIYYIIFIVLTFFSIITFYLNNKIKDYLIISLLSIIITLYLFEGYLYLIKENKKEQSQNIFLKKQLYEKETGNKYDERSKFEIYKDLKKIDKNIQLSVYPITFLNEQHKIYPLSGIANSKTIHCNESGYYSIYESDRHGFNNPDSEWDQNEIEYLLVGDSFTQGACVNRPHDIASVLRILSKKPVLNLGYSSNGSLSEYATLREYLNSNVKKVLWVFYDNDIGELETELTINKQLKNYINDLTFTQNLKLSQKKIDHMGITKIEKLLNWKKKNNEQSIVYHIKLNNVRSIINRFLPKKNQPHPKNEL